MEKGEGGDGEEVEKNEGCVLVDLPSRSLRAVLLAES